MQTRLAGTLIDILGAIVSREPTGARALVVKQAVGASCAVEAGFRCTLVDIDFAVLACPSAVAGACIPVWSSVRALALLAR